MAGIDEVLDRLRRDPVFREQLATDPKAALAGYELTTADLRVIAARVLGSRPKATGLAAFFGRTPTDDADPDRGVT